jgi:hypothetical protein
MKLGLHLEGPRLEAMGRAGAISLVCLSLVGCGDSKTPTSPTSPSPQPTSTPMACAGLVLSAAMSDATGDALTGGLPRPGPDLTEVRAAVSGCQLSMTIVFAPGTLSLADTSWQVLLDTDEDPATGVPGRNANHADPTAIGADYLVQRGSESGLADVFRSAGSGGFTGPVATVPVAIDGDQVSFVVPLAVLGGDDGRLVFSVNDEAQLSSGTFTPVLDYLPDLGAALPRTR